MKMMEQIANKMIEDARRLVASDHYRSAFNIYITAMDKCQSVKKRIEFEFRALLMKLMHAFGKASRHRHELLYCVRHAVRAFPGNVHLLSDIGDFFFKDGLFFEALCHYEKALAIDSSLVSVEIKLNESKKMVFDRALFRLYNDRTRNAVYATAIYSEISPTYERVLDLDGGIGLSALTAHACLAPSTVGFTASPAHTQLLQAVAQAHSCKRLVLLDRPIGAFVPSDIGGNRTLVMINNFDEGMLGPGLLADLKTAWESLLACDARALPFRGEYFVAGARSARINAKYRLHDSAKKRLNVPDSTVLCMLPRHKFLYTEDLETYDDVEIVTEPQFVFGVNFDRYNDVVMKNGLTYYDVNLVATESGEIDLIVGWFKLYLSKHISLTNDPRKASVSCEKRARGWPHAIFPDFIPTQVKIYQRTPLKFVLNEGKIAIQTPNSEKAHRISLPVLRFLNDTVFMDAIATSVSSACMYLQQIVDISETNVVDFSPFPMFGFLMMLRGARSLVCHVTNVRDQVFITSVFQANDIPLEKVSILIGHCWNHDFYSGQMYHAIFCTELNLRGDIDAHMWQTVEHLRIGHLAPGGLLLPMSISVMVQLASSEWLDMNNRLFDKNLNGFKMASHINKYQATQVHDLDLTVLKYEELSKPVLLTNCCNLSRSNIVPVTPLKDGECTAILCWYKLRLFEHEEEITTKRPGSFVNSFAYIPNPSVKMYKDEDVKLIRVIEPNGLSKIIIDTEY